MYKNTHHKAKFGRKGHTEPGKTLPSSKAPYPHTADAWGGQHLVTSMAFATALLVIISLLLYQGGCLLWRLDLQEA